MVDGGIESEVDTRSCLHRCLPRPPWRANHTNLTTIACTHTNSSREEERCLNDVEGYRPTLQLAFDEA